MSIEGRLTCPLKRGGSTTQDLSNLAGNEYSFVDSQYGTNRECRMKLVFNKTGITVQGKKLLQWDTGYASYPSTIAAGGTIPYGCGVLGYTTAPQGAWAGVSDDLLSSAGALANTFFLIGVKGPHMCTTSAIGASNVNNVAVGDKVVACTAAASTQTTDAGGVAGRALGVTQTTLANQIEHAVGRAATARGTTVTATDILVLVGEV